MKKLAQGFNTAAQDSNPGSLSRESEALPMSHCARRRYESCLHSRCVSVGLAGALNAPDKAVLVFLLA